MLKLQYLFCELKISYWSST